MVCLRNISVDTLHKEDTEDDDDDDNNNKNIIIIIIIIIIIMSMQKSVILGTCSIVRNFLNHK